jgi:hypothetical protein
MSNRPADLLLDDIRESIAKIQHYTAGLDRAGFEADEKGVDAVVRNLEIIGEAGRRSLRTSCTSMTGEPLQMRWISASISSAVSCCRLARETVIGVSPSSI